MPPPPAAVEDDSAAQNTGQSAEDEEATRRSNIAARMAKLGGIKFGAPPPVPATKRSMSTDPSSTIDEGPKSPIREVPPASTNEVDEGDDSQEASTQRAISPPAAAPQAEEGDETPEQEAARRRATLARLRAGGSLGFGMFGQGGHQAAASPAEDRGLEEQIPESEEGAKDEDAGVPPPVPSSRPPPAVPANEAESDEKVPPPPPPPARPGTHSRSATAESASFVDPSAPPPPGRPPVPSNRPIPPPPASAALPQAIQTENLGEVEGAPPPPPRPAQSPSLPPPSPMGGRPPIPSSDKRGSMTQAPNIRTDLPPPPIERQMTEEPGGMDMANAGAPSAPARLPQTQSPISPMPASPRRSTSTASRSSSAQQQPGMTPTSRQGSRVDDLPPPSLQGQPPLRSSMSQSRPGFNELQEASKQNGSKLIRAAKAMFSQGKQAYFGVSLCIQIASDPLRDGRS